MGIKACIYVDLRDGVTTPRLEQGLPEGFVLKSNHECGVEGYTHEVATWVHYYGPSGRRFSLSQPREAQRLNSPAAKQSARMNGSASWLRNERTDMSDFLIHAARMQDAGVKHLTVTLGTAHDRTRVMYVSADRDQPPELKQRFPTRTFELCGTDRVLEKLKDDMLYSDDGVTADKVQAAIDAHLLQADDLREWYADHLLCSAEPASEDPEPTAEDEAAGQRMADRVKAMLHGLDIARRRDAMKAA